MSNKSEEPIIDDTILQRIRKNEKEVEGMLTKNVWCHYCKHKTVVIYADTKGHVKAKCTKCHKEGIYNVLDYRKYRRIHFRKVCKCR